MSAAKGSQCCGQKYPTSKVNFDDPVKAVEFTVLFSIYHFANFGSRAFVCWNLMHPGDRLSRESVQMLAIIGSVTSAIANLYFSIWG
jgi:hypothetical protein